MGAFQVSRRKFYTEACFCLLTHNFGSHSNELVALILNHLISLGWWVISDSAGGAGGDISVYQSYLLASDNPDVAINSDLFVNIAGSGMRSPPHSNNAPLK